MIALLIQVLILCLILGLVLFIFNNVPLLAPFSWLAYVICVVIAVIFLINLLSGMGGAGLGMPAHWGLR